MLVVVDRFLERAIEAGDVTPAMRSALDDWDRVAPRLASLYETLNRDPTLGFPLEYEALAAPLPRAWQWLDGSAYLSHVRRVRQARGAGMPAALTSDPLMYQGASDTFLGPRDAIAVGDLSWGVDFESEVAIVTDDVAMGTSREAAREHIRLIMLVNDVSLRNLIPAELAKGFGFLHGKPSTAFSPVAVTPDELGVAWDGAKLHLPLVSTLNGRRLGDPDAGADMQFDFPALISHAAKTRDLTAGTIIGSGTVSNEDEARGVSCLVEKRVLEILAHGAARTPFMRYGDRVRIEMFNIKGEAPLGAIEQEIVPCPD